MVSSLFQKTIYSSFSSIKKEIVIDTLHDVQTAMVGNLRVLHVPKIIQCH